MLPARPFTVDDILNTVGPSARYGLLVDGAKRGCLWCGIGGVLKKWRLEDRPPSWWGGLGSFGFCGRLGCFF